MAKVLVACEESQRVCTAFRERGHEAYSCDILPCSGGHPEWHIQQDVLPLIDGNCSFTDARGGTHMIDGRWDLIIAFPPCTYISNAGACRLYPHKGQLDIDRYHKGIEGLAFLLRFLAADCPRRAVENPVSSSFFRVPKHTQEIQPWMFGHPYTKKTRLWLRGLPPLEPTKIMDERKPFLPSGTGRKLRGDSYGSRECAHDGCARSKTFEGIAEAMAEQWGGLLDD